MPLIETDPDALAHVYAQSLFELAGDADRLEAIDEELQGIIELTRSDASFNEFLASQTVPANKREASLRTILEGRVSDVTLRFLLLLNAKGRLSHLPAIVAAFNQRVQDALGRVEVDVFTAEPMENEQRESVGERIASKLGKQIALHTYVEPAMIGGIKIRIGDRLIDDSLATRLRRIRDRVARDGGAALRAKAQRVIRDDN